MIIRWKRAYLSLFFGMPEISEILKEMNGTSNSYIPGNPKGFYIEGYPLSCGV